jgi:Tfp pilus assembly protein PilE
VVVLIIGLLTIIALPTFSKFGSHTRLRSTAQQIDALLRTAKNFAITRNTTCTVKIHPRDVASPNQIELTYEEGGTEKQADKIWIAPSLIEIPDVSKYHGSIQTVEFKSDGRSTFSGGPECSIHIIQRGTSINGNPYNPEANYSGLSKGERVKCHTITTDSATGRSKIYYYGRNDPWANTDL